MGPFEVSASLIIDFIRVIFIAPVVFLSHEYKAQEKNMRTDNSGITRKPIHSVTPSLDTPEQSNNVVLDCTGVLHEVASECMLVESQSCNRVSSLCACIYDIILFMIIWKNIYFFFFLS